MTLRYVHRERDRFLFDHAKRFPPMGGLGGGVGGAGVTAAQVVNNIFRNYKHKWVYDFEEVLRVAAAAGVPRAAVARSSRLGPDLPPDFIAAIGEAEAVASARHQRGRSEDPTRCWLEQQVREGESLYMTIRKL